MYKRVKNLYKILFVVIFLVIILSSNFISFADEKPTIKAKAALIVEANTGKIIYGKNAYEQNYPASVTKILTAIITIENCKLDDVATVSESAISHIPSGYVVAPLYVGEKIKIKDLLYALMLESANDAAYVLAEHVGGSVEGFSDMMNEKAKELGCKDSHFVNPNGIHNEKHYTTAYDMYLISSYAMKNETFAEIVSKYQYTLPATNKYPYSNRVMKNTNIFVNPNSSNYIKKVKGIKTGTTAQAGNCLITDSAENGLEFITVVLGAETSDSKFSETKKMINYAFENYNLTQIHNKEDVVKNIEIENATDETKSLNLVLSDDVTVMKNNEIKPDDIELQIELNEDIKAPIYQGQELGTVKYNVDGLEYEAKLLAQHEVEVQTYYVQITVGVIVIVLIVAILVLKRKKKQRRRYK